MEKKKILITGASKGIGRAIVRQLADEYVLILHATAAESLKPVLAEIGGKHEILCADFSEQDQLKGFCVALKKMAGTSLYGVVNNAGITRDKSLLYQPEKEMDEVLNVNLKAPIMISKVALKIFNLNKQGVIINMGSCVGQTGNAFQVVYTMTKAAIVTMSKSIAKEVTALNPDHNIRVVTVSPGFIETNMTAELPENIKGKYAALIPSNRFGQPDEVAQVVKFLLSKQASYINGSEILVNGGLI